MSELIVNYHSYYKVGAANTFQNLRADWPLDESGGNLLYDRSNGRTATLPANIPWVDF